MLIDVPGENNGSEPFCTVIPFSYVVWYEWKTEGLKVTGEMKQPGEWRVEITWNLW